MTKMILHTSIRKMKEARATLGNPSGLAEAITATGIDAFFALLDGGTVTLSDGREVTLCESNLVLHRGTVTVEALDELTAAAWEAWRQDDTTVFDAIRAALDVFAATHGLIAAPENRR